MSKTGREKLALAITIVVTLGATVLFAPPPKVTVVNGAVHREATLGGAVIPKWLFFAIGVPLIALMWWGFYRLICWISPPPEEEEWTPLVDVVTVTETYPMEGGGFVAWQPEVPGTPSPMHYEPPVFTSEMTADEFLAQNGPEPMRTLAIGLAGWSAEHEHFLELQRGWIEKAPESTLHQLIDAGERIFTASRGELFANVAETLRLAHEMRGVPSEAELQALAYRLPDGDVKRILGGTDA